MEKHYAFLKNNRIVNVAVFAEEDEHLAAQIAAETGCDNAIWTAEQKPAIHSTWNGTSFEDPTFEYLVEIGILSELPKLEEELAIEK